MARTPLAGAVAETVAAAAESVHTGAPVDEVLERRRTRRAFLRDAAVLGAVATGAAHYARPARAAGTRVVVVGAGLAGLTAAHRLRQAGIHAEVYEASTRVGGRCWTQRGFFDDGQIAERGGELVDQSHGAIRNLAQELKLPLDNLLSAEQNGTEQTNWFDGARYSYEEATADVKASWQKIHKDVSAASYPTLYNLSTQRGRELDAMSIVDWIEETFEGGMESKVGRLLDVAYNIEYGAESTEQSALNLLYLLAYSGQGNLRIFGPSNEKYHVRGGNDQIPERLGAALAGQISTGHELVAIKRSSGGAYTLTFRSGGSTKVVTADKVVLAIPFSILRSSVDWSGAGFQPLKGVAIREQGIGTNSKLHVQFRDRPWRAQGFNGETFSDRGYQNSWEVSRAQAGRSGILVNYTGGNYGATFGSGSPASRAKTFLAQVEPVLPGVTKSYNGKASIEFWPGYEWTRGSYSYWRVGQYTKFAGVEREQEGNVHFCGEHTSVDFQGYLNGAVETGERAAAEVISDLR